MAKALIEKGCQFTDTDKHEDGTYVPLPNVAPRLIRERAEELEKNTVIQNQPPLFFQRGLPGVQKPS